MIVGLVPGVIVGTAIVSQVHPGWLRFATFIILLPLILMQAAGFRWTDGWTITVWSRNLLNKDYFDLLSAQPGNSGLYVGQPGDPRTVGVTLRMTFASN
jgi:hypothetical protein